ncbi:hypothetical protein [Ureibacillus sinduriensis]|uniref:Uncharacterized protein n=1 Tax=Ureibacillus sinduriensis BLB-1 = JCM 15800 TaxID=1384057 RepID=A0A0A3HXP5_9BACL|nr:hypothetical protein [Ureibacillus sinduriensis]KGR75143.1 hypothetical protein CD33_12790 [Ureibacillus sinduriensis BLB-1 = JCM 15800]
MESLLGSFIGVIIIIFGYMLLVKIISKVYHWMRWQRMNPTERKYEKIRQHRRRNYNASGKKSYDASPPGGD